VFQTYHCESNEVSLDPLAPDARIVKSAIVLLVAVKLVSSLRSMMSVVLVEVCTFQGSDSSGPGTFLLGLAILQV
jgi:hypothetical protein